MFSIIIPCFNRSKEIIHTLKSVQGQTYKEFECIIVDDGSQDGDELYRVVSSLNDSRFRVIRQENAGGGAARNAGIMAANNPWICFLDSDDLFLPKKLETYRAILPSISTNTVLYSQNYVERGVSRKWIRPNRAILPDEDVCSYMFIDNCFIQTSTICLNIDLIKKVMFNPLLRKGQDLDLCVNLQAAGAVFRMHDEPLSVWVDKSEEGRTSRHGGYEAPLKWLDSTSHKMSRKSVIGYKATILAYYMSHDKPLTSALYILDGWIRGGVKTSIIARQFARCFIPRQTYRRLVNSFVSKWGVN